MVKVAEGYNPQFDIDPKIRCRVREACTRCRTGFHEVKSDRRKLWRLEISLLSLKSFGAPSGIETTQADWWTFHLADGLFTVISTQRPKELCIKTEPRTVLGGDHEEQQGLPAAFEGDL